MQYIGETGRAFRQRMYEHNASVKKPVSKHFHMEYQSHNTRFSVMQWLGTNFNPSTQNKRRAKEMEFIWDVPIGINHFIALIHPIQWSIANSGWHRPTRQMTEKVALYIYFHYEHTSWPVPLCTRQVSPHTSFLSRQM